MASGIIDLGTSGLLKGRIVWSSSSNGTVANSSQVTGSIQAARTNSYTTTGTFKGALNIGGTTKDFSWYGKVSGSWVTLLSFTITRTHNNDGSGTCYISGQIDGPSGTSLAGKSVYNNQTVTLDTIPRQATVTSAPDFDDETKSIEIKYSNPAGNSVTSLKACISLTGAADDIAYRDISKTGTSYTFSLTDAEITELRKATTGSTSITVRFYVQTVIGEETYLDWSPATFTVINGKPTLAPTVVADEATFNLTGDYNRFIRGYSDASITVNAQAKKDAKITYQRIIVDGRMAEAHSDTNETVTYPNVQNPVFKFIVKDNREEFSDEVTVTKTLVDYVKLTCDLNATAPDAEGDMNFTITGNYFNDTFGKVANTLTVEYRYMVDDGEYCQWIPATPTKSGNRYSAAVSLKLNYQSKYTFQARASDKLMTNVETPEKALKTTPTFDWSAEDFNINGWLGFDSVGAVLRRNQDNGNVVLSAVDPEDGVFIRPNGTGNPEGQAIFDKTGKLTLGGSLSVGGRNYGTNKVLWSKPANLHGSQTNTLSEAISAQPNGIVLIFSRYSNGVAEDANFNFFYVPKEQVALHPGAGCCFNMVTVNFGLACCKYVYINDTTISGNDLNISSGTGASGVVYDNGAYVLRYVIGV